MDEIPYKSKSYNYRKSEIMENGMLQESTEGVPQGGLFNPLLANIFLNEADFRLKNRRIREKDIGK